MARHRTPADAESTFLDVLHGNRTAKMCQREGSKRVRADNAEKPPEVISPRAGLDAVAWVGRQPAATVRCDSLPSLPPGCGRGLYLTRGGNPLRVRNVFGSGGFMSCPAPRGPEPCGVVCFRRDGASGSAARCLRKHAVPALARHDRFA